MRQASFYPHLCLKPLSTASFYSKIFISAKKPFLTLLDIFKRKSNLNHIKQIKNIKRSISMAYLKNCSFEKHNNNFYITLDRKIVKDKCPGCGASIVDPVYEEYKCKYCGRKIMDVIIKK